MLILLLILQAEELVDSARKTYSPTAKITSEAQSILDLLNRLYIQIDGVYFAFSHNLNISLSWQKVKNIWRN